MVMITSKRKVWQSLAFFSGDKIYTNVNRKSNPKYINVCNKSAVKLLTSTIVTLIIVIGSMNIYVGFPVIASMFTDDLQLPIPVYFPFTDYKTKTGLFVNLLNNLFVASVGLAGNIGVEIITSMLKNTIWACTVAISHSIDEISASVEQPEPKSKEIIIHQFRNVLLQVQDYGRYISFLLK